MALRLYLSQTAFEIVRKELEEQPNPERKARLNGLWVRLDADGRAFYELRNERLPGPLMVPPALKQYVEYYSWLVPIWPDCPTQAIGRYEHATAQAVLDTAKEDLHRLTAHIYGQDLEHVCELYRKIRSGKAKLVESWEDEGLPTDGEGDHQDRQESLRFSCQSCQAEYAVSRKDLEGKSQLLTKCNKCGHDILIVRKPRPPEKKPGGNGPKDTNKPN